VNPQALPFVTAAEFDSVVTTADAIAALDAALSTGHAMRQSPLRTSTDLGVGHLLYMPASVDGWVGVKLVSVTPGNPAKGFPRIQGLYILFDGATLAPAAVFDAVSLTNSRTSALSAVAVDHLAPPSADTLLVFGTGPQAVAHVRAISSVRTLGEIVLVGYASASADALLGGNTGRWRARGWREHVRGSGVEVTDGPVSQPSPRAQLVRSRGRWVERPRDGP
jgi:ornithine cyclodeaminase